VPNHVHQPVTDYIVEEFIDGYIVTFDGLVNGNGKVVFHDSLRFGQGVMETVHSGDHMRFCVSRELPKDLLEAGLKTVEAFGLRKKLFHFEFFRRKDNSLVALEANLRVPGGPAIDVVNIGFQFDLYRQWANVLLYDRFEAPDPFQFRPCCYVSRKNNRSYVLSRSDVQRRFGRHIRVAEDLPEVWRQVLGDYYYILVHESEEELLRMADEIQREC